MPTPQYLLVPTSSLDAVNDMLAAIGESPVNSLNSTGISIVATAQNRLFMTSKRVQAKGWSWNTDWGMPLTPDSQGNIWLPQTALKTKLTPDFASQKLVFRNGQLYDPVNQTFTFTSAVAADVVTLLDFEWLPEMARQFIFISACRKFQQGFVGSDTLSGFEEKDEVTAWAQLLSEELEQQDSNILTDSYDTLSVLDRTSMSSASYTLLSGVVS